MKYSMTLAALAAGTLSVAAPTADIKAHQFSVQQVARGKHFKNGAIEILKASRKYGSTPSEALVKAAAAAQQGSVTASPSDSMDDSYICPVTTGSNTLHLDFDTGSSDLWVFSTDTPASEQGSHSLYNGEATGKLLSGYTWDITYEDGSGSKGIVYSDKVVIGPVTATSQAVEAATSASSGFVSDTSTDGLVGLAFSSINTVEPQQQLTFFDNVKSSLASPLFAAVLKHGKAGTYDFGYLDSSKYTGSIAYTAVDNSQGFWGFTAGATTVGGKSTGSVGAAIMDTGTTLLYLPSKVVSAYYAQVKGSSNSNTYGGYIFPCSATLPDWNVSIGGTTFTVTGSYFNYSPVSSGSSTCYGAMQPNSQTGGSTVFGDTFIKGHYIVFDQTQGSNSPRLGLAKQSSP
ncbi:Hypothetical protein R9X50_00151800 [Acrodontium crateriforme]|uniref:Peptidase A1 domain-containing protein n=1 Tax=Acrodontium crateriforme TaxID=150365 RepID=A0AAQ3R898_9PEZI|nr:Hypothetical protein R9X50_00151800 [Acrodontium crateriforme]